MLISLSHVYIFSHCFHLLFVASVKVAPSITSSGNLPVYARTAVFAILVLIVVFVLFVYCHGTIRHYITVRVSEKTEPFFT